jgi:hypothetical protein
MGFPLIPIIYKVSHLFTVGFFPTVLAKAGLLGCDLVYLVLYPQRSVTSRCLTRCHGPVIHDR